MCKGQKISKNFSEYRAIKTRIFGFFFICIISFKSHIKQPSQLVKTSLKTLFYPYD